MHVDQELHLADNAVTTPVPPTAAASWSKGEFPQDDGVASLEDLRIRDARVGHVAVDAVFSLPGRSCAAATRDGLVVSKARVVGGLREPKCEIGHASVACGANLQRL